LAQDIDLGLGFASPATFQEPVLFGSVPDRVVGPPVLEPHPLDVIEAPSARTTEGLWSEIDEDFAEIDPVPRGGAALRSWPYERSAYRSYRTGDATLEFLPGDGDSFGALSFLTSPYLEPGSGSGATGAINIHLLSGPEVVPLPPRLYDFILGYQWRGTYARRFSYDLATQVGVFSDFEDSARDGVRFPGHAVGMVHFSDRLDLVFGVDYLHRDDVKILPVFGYSWHDPLRPAWRFDWVFPRPTIQYSLDRDRRLYLASWMGGGTWDIEMPSEVDDVVTYRDFRLVFGCEWSKDKGSREAIELGLVFNRDIQFRSQATEASVDNALVVRFVSRR
jgi:hypothetical protein